MKREDVIRMAIEADLVPDALWDNPELERFAELVAAAEREACAKLCGELGQAMLRGGKLQAGAVSKRIEDAIRARSTT